MPETAPNAATTSVADIIDAKLVNHTRRCNKRKAVAKKRRAVNTTKPSTAAALKSRMQRYQKLTNIQQLSFELKLYITSFLSPLALGRLGMTNKKLKHDVDLMAKQATGKFLAEAPSDKVLKQKKPKAKESWSQFMYNQMTCVHKLFVYYTGYKTGRMRQEFPHWAFGIVYVDPNEPHRVILPNAWTFHGHNPWLQRRGNGKDGEWHLMKKYTANKAPHDFLMHVQSWASTIRLGSMLAVAYQNAGSMTPAWWEAQAWYIWRGDGKQCKEVMIEIVEDNWPSLNIMVCVIDPAVVYDPETEKRIHVHPNDLLEHFRAHPLHVIDVSSKSGALCSRCASQNRTFKYCHLDRGHPML